MTEAPHRAAVGRVSPVRNAAPSLVSAAISLAMHSAVFALAILWKESKPGVIDLPSTAISIELSQTEIIEATTQSLLVTSAPALTSTAIETGSDASRAVARPHVEQSSETKWLPPTEAVPIQGVEDLEIIRGHSLTEVHSQQSSHDREKATVQQRLKSMAKALKTAKLTEPTPAKANDDTPSQKGGIRSRAARGSALSSGRVSASSGSALNYAATVRARVAGRKPSGRGRRGTVVVSFGVTRSGGLSYASVARSSGDPGLDSSVLSAVRSAAPFPAPPPGAQLRFAMPFYFR